MLHTNQLVSKTENFDSHNAFQFLQHSSGSSKFSVGKGTGSCMQEENVVYVVHMRECINREKLNVLAVLCLFRGGEQMIQCEERKLEV